MLSLICFMLLSLTQAEIITDRKCDNVVEFNGVQYEKEVLVNGYDSPYQLAIDPVTKTLFFSYSTESSDDAFKSIYLDMETKNHGVVEGIKGGFAHAVDVNNHIVYLGSSESGIYTLNYEAKKATPLNITNFSIWQMFYNNGLYFTTYPEEKAYIYKNGVVQPIKQLQHSKTLLIAVDNNQNIYFSNSSGLFVQNTENEVTHLSDTILNGFSSDKMGKLYFSTPTGIYSLTEEKTIKEILRSNDVFGLAIEGDNIVYATKTSIIRLKPTQIQCLTENKNTTQ